MIEYTVDYYGIIQLLVNEGFNILEVFAPDRKYYFVVMEFNEPYFNSAQSVDFGVVKGTEISEFLKKNDSLVNPTNLIHNLNNYIDQTDMYEMRFSKNITWVRWANIASKRR